MSIYVLNIIKIYFLGKGVKAKIEAVLFSSYNRPNHVVYLLRLYPYRRLIEIFLLIEVENSPDVHRITDTHKKYG